MKRILIHEVGPRDGLQIEKRIVPTAQKIAWIETILESGVDVVQLGSFVSAERVPQMADTAQLFARFHGRKFSALVLNEKGFERGLACGVEYFCMGASASDTHSRKNTGMSTEEAMTRIVAIAKRALTSGATVQVSVQSAFGCGYEGKIPQERVLDMVKRYLDAGLLQISLADTAGHANPSQVEDLFGAIWMLEPAAALACHFHDTYGLALANCYAALRSGVQSFESAVGGLGGCPFTATSSGNVPTEKLVHMLQGMGMREDIALGPLMDAAREAREMVSRGDAEGAENSKALENIRVLDMTNVLAGPFATELLALLGAEVIKIENPEGGDLARKLGCVAKLNQELMGTSFLAQNANKKSLTLNLKLDAAKEIFLKLVDTADVLVENFRPGVMDRLGLGYNALAARNPRLVVCAISGFGQTGPDAHKPAYDQIIQGLSGVMAINGDERLNPLRCGFPVGDTVGGLNAAFAIMAALFHRERSGEGQRIDVALLDSIMPMMGWVAANLLIGGQQPQLMGNDNFTAAPSGTFRTADGFINIAANQQQQWEDLAGVLGVPELTRDPRFHERDTRKKNRALLTPLLEQRLTSAPTAHWVQALNSKGIPSGAIMSLEEALTAPQIVHRQSIQTIEDPRLGPLQLFTLTAKFEKTPGALESPPPRLSQHTDEILGTLGYSSEQIARLHADAAV